jgi:hypothetical protein
VWVTVRRNLESIQSSPPLAHSSSDWSAVLGQALERRRRLGPLPWKVYSDPFLLLGPGLLGPRAGFFELVLPGGLLGFEGESSSSPEFNLTHFLKDTTPVSIAMTGWILTRPTQFSDHWGLRT